MGKYSAELTAIVATLCVIAILFLFPFSIACLDMFYEAKMLKHKETVQALQNGYIQKEINGQILWVKEHMGN